MHILSTYGLVLLGLVALSPQQRADQESARFQVRSILFAQGQFQMRRGRFASNFEELSAEQNFRQVLRSYQFAFVARGSGVGSRVVVTATTSDRQLKAYSGMIAIYDLKQVFHPTIICETQQPGTPPLIPIRGPKELTCPPGSVKVLEKI